MRLVPEAINQVQDDGEEYTQQDACSDRDVQPEILSFDDDVAGQAAKPPKLFGVMKDQSGNQEHSTYQHQYLAYPHLYTLIF